MPGHGNRPSHSKSPKPSHTVKRFWRLDRPRRRVLVIDAEQGLRTVKRRLRETGLDMSGSVDYLRVPDGNQLDQDDDEAEAVERVLRPAAMGW